MIEKIKRDPRSEYTFDDCKNLFLDLVKDDETVLLSQSLFQDMVEENVFLGKITFVLSRETKKKLTPKRKKLR